MEVDILTLGATVALIKFPVNGELKEMTVTYDKDFKQDTYYIDATAGRFANRIAKGQFSLTGDLGQFTGR